MALVGYARVSTEDQTAEQQATALIAAGCALVHRETASGASRARPVLNRFLGQLGRGDVLVVVRIDRLTRSLRHLLDVIETLEARGTGFRSLSDPIDTTTPQGRFALQILGAVAAVAALMREHPALTLAELERRLLSRRIYPARGRKDWAISTLRLIRIAARERGLL